jgi:hypothetical protein
MPRGITSNFRTQEMICHSTKIYNTNGPVPFSVCYPTSFPNPRYARTLSKDANVIKLKTWPFLHLISSPLLISDLGDCSASQVWIPDHLLVHAHDRLRSVPFVSSGVDTVSGRLRDKFHRHHLPNRQKFQEAVVSGVDSMGLECLPQCPFLVRQTLSEGTEWLAPIVWETAVS